MKVSIGTNIKDGPWGGGNLFAINLKNYLVQQNHEVVHNLLDDDIDIILITEPRKTSESSAFTHIDVLNYLKFVNNKALVVHRVNECDERKNTNYVNKYLISANNIADYTIFVSTWIKNLYENQGISQKNNFVVMAGADEKIFSKKKYTKDLTSRKTKLITHHWGANWNKGFDTYLLLDNLMGTKKYKDKIEFTYIGNIPKNLKFINTKVLKPMSGNELATEIRDHNIYITGSLNEPSGNHHIEGAQCGLPLLYINSGGIPEYCHGYGVIFEPDNFEEKLDLILNNFETYLKKVQDYPHSSKKMCNDYLNLFNEMLQNKKKLLSERQLDLSYGYLTKLYFNLIKKIKEFYS
jgi:hypothetical protein